MVTKPDYIQYLEIQGGVFSVMKFHQFDKSVIKYLDEKSMTRVYEIGKVPKNGKALWEEVIYQTKQNFYIHVFDLDLEHESYYINIYYKAEQRNELLLFTTQMLKPFKDATINDTGTKTEN